MGVKRGEIRWHCQYDHEDKRVTFDEMVCRTIRKPYTYWVHKLAGITWVKLSSKHGDYGWDKNLHSIWRTQCWNGRTLSDYGLGKTKLAAARLALARERNGLKRWKKPDPKFAASKETQAEIEAEFVVSINKLAAYVKRNGGKK